MQPNAILNPTVSDPTYPLFPICAGVGLALVLLPAYWQFRCQNVGTMAYIIWTFIGNLNYLINSIAWAQGVHDSPWIWCDFSSAIIIALNVAIPTSSLLITRNLASVSALRQVNISKSSRTMYLEIAIGTGIPLLAVLAHVIVQGHRFDIIECLGCWPAVWMTPVAILLVLLPPIVINLVSAYYASIAIRAIFIQRRQFRKTVLTATGLPFSTYLRLMALATTEIIVSLPAGIFVMSLNLRDGVNPWISWTDTHLNFNRVEKLSFAWVSRSEHTLTRLHISRYSLPLGSLLFFVYVGMGGESGVFYRRQFWRLANCLGIPSPSEATPSAPPIIIRPHVTAFSQLKALRPSQSVQPNGSDNSVALDSSPTGNQSNPLWLLPTPLCLSEEGWLEAELADVLQEPPRVHCDWMA